MSLLVRQQPEASYDDLQANLPRGGRRRRTAPWLLAAAGLVVGWALLPATVGIADEVAPELPVDAGLFVPEYGEDGTYGLHYRHHETVTITVPVHNGGPLPLRVDRVHLDNPALPLLVPVGDNLPVSVGPGGDADVALTFRFDNCRYYHERSAQTWDHVVVEGSVLRRGFSTEAALAFPIALHGQVINNCPDRTLTRGDEVRPTQVVE